MPIYDQNGIPIVGKEDDAKAKIAELSKNLVMAKGLIRELQEKMEFLKASNTNVLCFMFALMEKTENNRFRVPLKKLESLRAEFLNNQMILKTYKDKADNVVIYLEKIKQKKEDRDEKEKG